MHLTAGVLVALSGAVSGIFVVIANALMNAPVGFEVVDGRPVAPEAREVFRHLPCTVEHRSRSVCPEPASTCA